MGSSDEESTTVASNNRDSMASEDSTTSILSPLPGAVWENEVTEIELVKGDNGLGFSVLEDYAVSLVSIIIALFL